MDQLLPADFEPTSRVLKRAQYEAFAFSVLDGDIRVRNESHENPANHEYRVSVVDGIPATCECPADAAYEGPCKHRVAIAIRSRILELVTKVQVVADGGTTANDRCEPAESDQCDCDKLDDEFPCWNCVRTGRKTLPEK
ncbi:SWIM zinc finger domain-containing protein [Halogeometricum sp. S1BR25-6]|uniref:SWIM zinc finger domain-containing protein n=1 Tax=Halogeometricum salsisoli TaxID=2950536 RepID=A0ABU2GJH3_9EURY|nr:SWIM zinc finger family protein [Halogeometricum sp. S1BR25-6]MDS0300967.1 SWIM zinc finger domain-containing protein [Halogeometricum sp. S1BR25-6]